MPDALQRLNDLKAEIDNATASKNKLDGERKSVIDRMEFKHGVNTIDAAKKLVAKQEKELAGIVDQIDEGMTKLEEEYQW